MMASRVLFWMVLTFFSMSRADTEVTEAPTPHPVPPFCWLSDGCANAATCQCVWWVSYCNVDHVTEGHCSLTNAGLSVLIVGIIVGLALLTCCIGCCMCVCGRCCCKRKHYDPPQIQYHFVHGPQAPQTFTPYDKL